MGMPSGLARSSSAHAERKPAAAAFVAALFKNFLLEIADIDPPYPPGRAASLSLRWADALYSDGAEEVGSHPLRPVPLRSVMIVSAGTLSHNSFDPSGQ